MQHYYIGQWVWNDSEPQHPLWEAPNSSLCVGTIDLRNLNQQALAGGVAEGYALFSYSEEIPNPDLIYIGFSKDAVLSNKVKDAVSTAFNLKSELKASNIADLIHELLFDHADPTGQTACKPLIPNDKLDCNIYIGTEGLVKSTKIIPEVSPEWDKIIATYQEDYKRALLTTDPITIAKNLDFLQEQYGISYDKFIPADATEIITPLPHETTITESFNTADSTTLGPDLTWTETRNDLEVKSNKATTSSGAVAIARAESDLSSANHYSQAVLTYTSATNGVSNQMGVAVRHHASDVSCYWGGYNTFSTPSDRLRIEKIVTGTITGLVGPDTSGTATSPVTIKLTVNGSDLEFFVAGVSRLTTTDTSITGNLRCGIMGSCTTVTSTQLDDWEAADLGSSVTVTPSALTITSTAVNSVLGVLSLSTSLLAPTISAGGSIIVSQSSITLVSSVVSPNIFPSTSFVQNIASGESADTLFTNSDCYVYLLNTPGAYWNNVVDNSVRNLIPTPGYFKNLNVRVATAPGAGKSWVFTVLRNDVSTGITLTISDTNTTGSDTSHNLYVVAGDTVTLKASPSGTPASTVATWTIDFVPTIANYSIFCFAHGTPSNAQGDFGAVVGTFGWESLETYAQQVFPTSGTVKLAYVQDTIAPGSGKSYDLMFRNNGADTALHPNLADTNTIASDTTNSFTVSAGDIISCQYRPTNTPADDTPIMSWVFVPDTTSEFPLIAQGLWSVATGATYYLPVHGCDFGSGGAGTSSNRIELVNNCVIKKIQVKIIGAALPGGGSKTYTLRKNGVNTSLTVTITSPDTTGTASVNIPIADGDYLDTVVTQSGALTGVRTDLVSYTSTHDVVVSMSTLSLASSVVAPTVSLSQAVTRTIGTGYLVTSTQVPVFSATGDITVQVSALTLVSSTIAPSILLDVVNSISTLTIVSSLNAPNIITDGSATFQASALTIVSSVVAPSLSLGATITPSALTLVSSLNSPTIITANDVVVAMSTLTLVSSVVTGSITTTSDITIIPFSVTLVSSVNAPTVTSGITLSLSSLTLASSIVSPSILKDYVQSVGSLTLVSSVISPSTSTEVVISLGTLTLTSSVNNPTLVLDSVITANTLSLVSSLLAPNILLDFVISISPQTLVSSLNPLTLVSSLNSPSILYDVTVVQGVLTLASSLLSPTIIVTTNITVAIDSLTLVSSLVSPTVSGSGNVTISISPLTLVSSVNAPTIATSTNVTITQGILTIVSSVVSPVISTSTTISPSVLTIVSSVNAPTIVTTTNVTVAISPLTVVSSLNSITISTSGNISIGLNSLTLVSSVVAPSISGIANVTLSPLTIVSSLNSPAISGSATVTPNTLTIVSSVNNPTILTSGNVSISLNTQTLVSSIVSPSVITNVNLSLSPLTLVSSLNAVTVTSGLSITVNPLNIVSSVNTPSLLYSSVLSMSSLVLVSNYFSPSIFTVGNVVIGINSLTIVSSVNNVSVSIAMYLYPDALTLTLSIVSPTLSVIKNVTVAPNQLDLAISLLAPTILALRLRYPILTRDVIIREYQDIKIRFEEYLNSKIRFTEKEDINLRIRENLELKNKITNKLDTKIKIK